MGRSREPDKRLLQEQIAAMVRLRMKREDEKIGEARAAVSRTLGTSLDTVKRAYRETYLRCTPEQRERFHLTRQRMEWELLLDPAKHRARIENLRKRLPEIRASRGIPAKRKPRRITAPP